MIFKVKSTVFEIEVINCPCCKGVKVNELLSYGSEPCLICGDCGCTWWNSKRREAIESEA